MGYCWDIVGVLMGYLIIIRLSLNFRASEQAPKNSHGTCNVQVNVTHDRTYKPAEHTDDCHWAER